MRQYYDTDRFYKDSRRKKVTGVCSGIAKHYKTEPWIVRLITLAVFLMFPTAVLIAYLAATVLLPSR